jgi:hypothetical protein
VADAQPALSAAAQSYVPSSRLNRAIPHWVRFSGEDRFRLEGFSGGGFQPGSQDFYALNRLRWNMSLLPASWLQFRFQLQDSRVAAKALKPYAPPFQDTFDLRIAYVEFGDAEKSHAGLRVGRQEINVGEERLVGSSGWGNTARSFDAARLSLHWGKFRLDAFTASPVVLHDGDVGDHVPGNNLHGIYAGFEDIIPGSRLEPYLLWRINQRLKTELGGTGNLDFTTAGVRWSGKLPYRLDYNLEVARQQGSLGSDRIQAWAGHWALGYAAARVWSSRLVTEFNYASGDGNSRDGLRQTFDTLFPSAHEKHGVTDQVGWNNILHYRAGLECNPARKWTAAYKFNAYWLADPHDALYGASGAAAARNAAGTAGRFVGTELDGIVGYSISKQLQVGAGFGHLFPGAFLRNTTPGKGYSYPYLMLTAAL